MRLFSWACCSVLLSCGLLLFSTPSTADEFKANTIEWENSSFWTGLTAGILTHELGHVITAASFGQKSRLHGGSIRYPGHSFSPKQSLVVSSAGFQAQWLLSEWSFSKLKEKEQNAVLDNQHYIGFITAHLAISYAYLAILKDEPTSDIYASSIASGRSRNQLALATVIPAILDTYRLFGDNVPDWVSKTSLSFKAGEIGLIWSF